MSLRLTPTLNDTQYKKFAELAQMQGITPNQLAKRLCVFYIKSTYEFERLIGQILLQENNVEIYLKNDVS
ncbi:MAG TPA: hypothetical protein VGC76_13060 [Pyrinomonadaceae bacterium]|jgi:hypothetical protein